MADELLGRSQTLVTRSGLFPLAEGRSDKRPEKGENLLYHPDNGLDEVLYGKEQDDEDDCDDNDEIDNIFFVFPVDVVQVGERIEVPGKGRESEGTTRFLKKILFLELVAEVLGSYPGQDVIVAKVAVDVAEKVGGLDLVGLSSFFPG